MQGFLTNVLCYVAALLRELDEGISQAISSAWSKNTVATRNSQWTSYLNFCAENGLKGLPAEDLTIARFLLFKAKTVKYSTINNYLSAICVLHRYYGFTPEFRDRFFIKMVLDGLKHILGQSVNQKVSLDVHQLLDMYRYVHVDDVGQMLMWCSIVISFRTLLRKSNLLPEGDGKGDEHVIKRKDVTKDSYGYNIYVHSSKTIRNKSRVLKIPVVRSGKSVLCGVGALDYALAHDGGPEDPIFMLNSQPVLYRHVLKFLKQLVKSIGLDPGEAGLHSLRRSGAQFLQKIGVPLTDIMFMGDWKSLAVLSYLITTFDKKVQIEDMASRYLQEIPDSS